MPEVMNRPETLTRWKMYEMLRDSGTGDSKLAVLREFAEKDKKASGLSLYNFYAAHCRKINELRAPTGMATPTPTINEGYGVGTLQKMVRILKGIPLPPPKAWDRRREDRIEVPMSMNDDGK